MTVSSGPGKSISITLFVWLVGVWLMLWGKVSIQLVVFGVVLALTVLVMYPLPRVRTRMFARPVRLLGLAAYVVVDLLLSALRVSWQSIRHGPKVRAAVIAVPSLSDVDYEIASTANMVSLAPGKFVLQIDRGQGIFYVYALGVSTPASVVRTHNDVVDLQVRVIKVFGSASDIAGVRRLAQQVRRQQPAGEGVI